MKRAVVLLICLVFFVAVQSCDLGGNDGLASGSIQILSVTPNSGLTDDTPTDFVVEVEYELSQASQGELVVGFNYGSNIDIYGLISGAKFIVSEGTGQHIFNVTALTKDWGASGDFKAYVNISEYPHGDTWIPLDSDTMVLTF
jgi:hypothetical protein